MIYGSEKKKMTQHSKNGKELTHKYQKRENITNKKPGNLKVQWQGIGIKIVVVVDDIYLTYWKL